jgi:site-specific DNA recombinase
MERCVIYARVSTREQQDEGYSIPAQLKAIREFCASHGLSPMAEFVEAESAGKAGRKRFTEMVDFLKADPETRIVVAHKLDRLYRNFTDQVLLEEVVGARARYVTGDVPDSPQGELLRDVQLSVAKFYLGNLAEEVRKGMDEKVRQGGWPHPAPLGYFNDKPTRSILPDPLTAPLVRLGFERYATGVVSLSQLSDELASRGLLERSGRKLSDSYLHRILTNPMYCGRIRYKGAIYPGAHEPLVTPALFQTVQDTLTGNRNGTKSRRVFALRGVMYCAECGCLITAGVHKGHVYYRCTHGRGSCGNR